MPWYMWRGSALVTLRPEGRPSRPRAASEVAKGSNRDRELRGACNCMRGRSDLRPRYGCVHLSRPPPQSMTVLCHLCRVHSKPGDTRQERSSADDKGQAVRRLRTPVLRGGGTFFWRTRPPRPACTRCGGLLRRDIGDQVGRVLLRNRTRPQRLALRPREPHARIQVCHHIVLRCRQVFADQPP